MSVQLRQIREAAVQFLYSADIEGEAVVAAQRDTFWEIISEKERRDFNVLLFRMIYDMTSGRDARLSDFVERQELATKLLAGYPEAEALKSALKRVSQLESAWSLTFDQIANLSKDGRPGGVAKMFELRIAELFKIDRDVRAVRREFFQSMEDFPKLKNTLDGVAASMRRLQKISDKLATAESPENYLEIVELNKLREAKSGLSEWRTKADALIDAVLFNKEEIHRMITSTVDNFSSARIDTVDRAIMSVAVYELLKTDTPLKVVINEAIELAKRFGTTDSGRFANGVLDQIGSKCRANEK